MIIKTRVKGITINETIFQSININVLILVTLKDIKSKKHDTISLIILTNLRMLLLILVAKLLYVRVMTDERK